MPEKNGGIITIPSNHSVEETIENLKAILQSKGITLFALIDHSGEAAKAGMEMRPTELLIFGNPKGGTPVMLAAPSSAIDPSAQDFDLGRCSGKSLGYLQWSDVFAGTAQHSNRAAAKPERDRGAGKECCGIALCSIMAYSILT